MAQDRRAASLLALLLLVATACAAVATGSHSDVVERLAVRPLPAARQALALFQFSVDAHEDSTEAALVPSALRQLLTAADAEALRLSFALGRWSDARYGSAQALDGSGDAHAPFGANLQVILRPGDDVAERWRAATAELGALFSASLGQLDDTVVAGLSDGDSGNETLVLDGGLAREELCTENLTPWLAMLPCRSRAGLGRLLDPTRLLSSEYLALQLSVERSASTGRVKLRQLLTVVRPVGSLPSPSLADLFIDASSEEGDSSSPLAACPLTTESSIDVVPLDGSPLPAVDLKKTPVALTDPVESASWWKQDANSFVGRDVVSAHRFVTGYGQFRGGIAVQLTNAHPRCAVRVRYQDSLPWFLRLYGSSLRVASINDAVLEQSTFVPAELRSRPNELAVELLLPANGSAVVSVEFDKAFIRLSEHPPDANRGFDVAPGVAQFEVVVNDDSSESQGECATLHREQRGRFSATQFTEPLLVPLPTPDFSMPYNVITMTSTVVAFFVGSMLNSLLRKAPRLQQLVRDGQTRA